MDSLKIKTNKKEIVMWTDKKKKFIELGAMGDSS